MPQATHRVAMIAMAIAIVLVPTMARARQQIEHRDATRLSIKHNWLGVAPPSRTTLALQQVIALPAVATWPALPQSAQRSPIVADTPFRPLVPHAEDLLRGPPSFPR